MTRFTRAWGALAPEQRIATIAAVALLVTMFFPWYELQSLNPKTHAIDSRSISAFGDVSFVEAAVFLVAAGVIALLFARAERRDFHMPGSDGVVVMIAGGWAALLIFYRVFSRPTGHGYPVGIQWGFFLAFVAAGALTYAGWRMRATATPEPPLMRSRTRRRPATDEDITVVAPSPQRAERSTPVAARPAGPSEETTHVVARGPQRAQGSVPVMADRPQSPPRTNPSPPIQQASPSSPPPAATRRAAGSRQRRPRYPPKPSDQLSFEDQPSSEDQPYHSPDDAP